MKKNILIVVHILFGTVLFAQNNIDPSNVRPINGININLLGDASLVSINYERLLLINSNFFIAGKAGLGYNEDFNICIFGPCSPPEKYLTIPHLITGNLGIDVLFFEFGLGGTLISGNTNRHYLFYPIVGFRLQPLKSIGMNFRGFFQYPHIDVLHEVNSLLFLPFGLSLGVCF